MRHHPDADAVEGMVRLPVTNQPWPLVHIRSSDPERWTVTWNEMRIDNVQVSVFFDLRALAKLFQIEVADLSDNACILWRREIRCQLSDVGFQPSDYFPEEYFPDGGDVKVHEFHEEGRVWFEVIHSWVEVDYDHEGKYYYDRRLFDLSSPQYTSLIEAQAAALALSKAKKAFLHADTVKHDDERRAVGK